MALKYRLVQKGNPAKPDDPKKFYANSVTRGDISLRELAKEIAEISTVSVVDTSAVIESLLQIIPRHVIDGEIVRLGDFGSFSVRLSSEGAESESSFSSNLIKGVKLSFRPGKELKKALDDAEFEKE